MCLFNVCLFIIGSTLVLKTIESKKYDVEAEALKLYSEDIHDVVARFRRTPDYLKILNSKLKSLMTSVQDMSIQTTYYYVLKLKEKVADLLGIQQSDLMEVAPDAIMENEHKPDKDSGSRFRRRGLGSKENNSSQEISSKERKLRVQKLDSYYRLSSTLTLAQRNSLKDLGFEFTGHIVHSLIRSLGGNDMEDKYTRLPDGGDNPDSRTTPTTRHADVHEVSAAHANLPGGPVTLEGGNTKLFFFRHGTNNST